MTIAVSTLRRCCALLAVLLLAVTGCAPQGARDGGSNTLAFAIDTQPECLDPQVSPYDVTALVDRNIFDSLVSTTPDGKAHPWLATSWRLSHDGRSYTFRLRPDVVFHDGATLDAAAVKATLDHTVDPRTKSKYAANLIASYRKATVLDDRTLRVDLARPDAAFLQALGSAYLGIQSPKSLRENRAGLCSRPVGSGPFSFAGWVRNRTIDLKRNPAYQWGPTDAAHTGPAHVDGITFSVISENSVRFGALTSGQVDAAGNLPPSKAALLERSAGLRLLQTRAPGAVYAMYLNSSEGPLADERVRIALQHALRLDQLVDSVYFGRYQRSWSLLSPATAGYDRSLRGTWTYDPARADKLLDAAGWTGRDAAGYRTKDGHRLTLRWPYATRNVREQRDVLGEGIQGEAKRVGIEIDYVGEDIGKFSQSVVERRGLDLFASSYGRAEPDILRYLYASDQTVPTGGGNVFGVKSRRLDAWLSEAAQSTDNAVRERRYAQVQRYLVKHALVIPLYVYTSLVGATDDVRGLRFDAQAIPLFYDASLRRTA